MPGSSPSAPRCAAIVGNYLSGKTTLLEALLHSCGAIDRRGTVREGNTVGDASEEARSRQMSIEISAASADFLSERWTFLDCPGSVEFLQESLASLKVADAAIVVCEPVVDKALALAPILHFLDDNDIPHMLFINKMDTATTRISELMQALQSVSSRPLVLRHVPIRDGDHITGYVDVVSERAYEYKAGGPSDLVPLPESVKDREAEARQELLETLADFDDTLLEQLLEDIVPSKQDVYAHLTRDFREDLIVPVFLGAAEQGSGVLRLLKALRHECPGSEATAARNGVPAGDPVIQVFKTYYMPHTGKISLGRVWSGDIKDGLALGAHKVSGLGRIKGHHLDKIATAGPGDVVALARLDEVKTGDVLGPDGVIEDAVDWPDPLKPVYGMAINAKRREDEVKLSTGLARLSEEDASLTYEHNEDTHELILWGQGDIHLSVAGNRLQSIYNVEIESQQPRVPYKETIRKGTEQHARHKKQSGGHGEFGDVHVRIGPLPRGTGFQFEQQVVGGSVPRQYIPAVEAGVKEYLDHGPLGFKVVDVAVTLYDGQHHSVDSSDMAFRKAGIAAMKEGMPKCNPVLLEPICEVTISVPNEHTSKAQGIITRRRGQILGFDAKGGWQNWDEVKAYLPQSEMRDLIIELRSLTQGVGTFDWSFDHLNELTGRLADDVVAAQGAGAEAAE